MPAAENHRLPPRREFWLTLSEVRRGLGPSSARGEGDFPRKLQALGSHPWISEYLMMQAFTVSRRPWSQARFCKIASVGYKPLPVRRQATNRALFHTRWAWKHADGLGVVKYSSQAFSSLWLIDSQRTILYRVKAGVWNCHGHLGCSFKVMSWAFEFQGCKSHLMEIGSQDQYIDIKPSPFPVIH
jgi:hypothetical protein